MENIITNATPTTQVVQTSSSAQLPPEFKNLHDALYNKIIAMTSGSNIININDVTILIILIQSAMTIVEKFVNSDGKGYSGPEKKQIAITLIQTVISDLSTNGKIPPEIAQEINKNLSFWGPLVIDISVAAGNKLFDIGQKFVKDEQTLGCKGACKKDCCCCMM